MTLSVAQAEAHPVVAVPRRGVLGWMLFDWAAQPFFTVVTTFIFGPYLVSRVAATPEEGQAAWGFGIALAGLAIAVLSPVLGSVADQTGSRKPWIAVFALVKMAALTGLWWAAPGSSLFWAVLLYSVASVAAEFSVVFNDAMLPRLVSSTAVGRVSNIAWGLGYLGGMIVLIFVVLFLSAPPETGSTLLGLVPLWGLDAAQGEDARAATLISAAWYALFILPMFLFTPDRGMGRPLAEAVQSGLAELKGTYAELKRRSGLFRFLLARMVYQDGIGALLALGGSFATLLFGWTLTEIGAFGILLNVAAIAGCLLAARLDTAFGSKRVVLLSLACLLLATLGIIGTGPGYTLFGFLPLTGADAGGLFGSPAEKAYLLFGLLIGLAFGPAQASSRAYLARSVPAEDAGRFFGLFALTGRVTSFLAPFLVASVTALSGNAALGMAAIIPFFALGLLLLWRTPYPADRVG